MKWVNRNPAGYKMGVFKNILIILFFVTTTLLLFSLFDSRMGVSVFSFMLSITFLFSIIAHSRMAKFRINYVEIVDEVITIKFYRYNTLLEITCEVQNILFEIKSEHHSDGVVYVYVNNELVLKQNSSYWKSDLRIHEFHQQLKEYLPPHCVTVI